MRFSVTIRQVREDGSEVPVDGELAAALAGPVERVHLFNRCQYLLISG